MRNLSENEIELCKIQARIFERSLNDEQCSSPVFIRRFMYSDTAQSMDEGTYFMQVSDSANGYGSNYGSIKYSADALFWIGYVYRAISILFNISSANLFKLLPSSKIIGYFNTFHTFDIVYAAERIMESIGYAVSDTDFDRRGVEILKRLRGL